MSLSSNKIKGTISSNDPDQEGKPKKRKKSSIRKNQKNKFLSGRIKIGLIESEAGKIRLIEEY